jgi:hypothetical protein
MKVKCWLCTANGLEKDIPWWWKSECTVCEGKREVEADVLGVDPHYENELERQAHKVISELINKKSDIAYLIFGILVETGLDKKSMDLIYKEVAGYFDYQKGRWKKLDDELINKGYAWIYEKKQELMFAEEPLSLPQQDDISDEDLPF